MRSDEISDKNRSTSLQNTPVATNSVVKSANNLINWKPTGRIDPILEASWQKYCTPENNHIVIVTKATKKR